MSLLKNPVSARYSLLWEPNQNQLPEVAVLLNAHKLRAFAAAVFPLEQVREAYAVAQRGGNQGKVTLTIFKA